MTPSPTPAVVAAPSTPAPGRVRLEVTTAVRLVQSLAGPVLLDELGTRTQARPFETRLRITPQLNVGRWDVISEFDAATGALFGTPSVTVVAPRQPTPTLRPFELRQLYGQYRWDWGVARLGVQANQFGLGMLANSGAKDAQPGDFGIQHGGSVVARAAVGARPLADWGGAWAAVEPVAAFDLVVRDNTTDLLAGDRALQGILGLRYVEDDAHQVALTAIYRSRVKLNGAPGEGAVDVFVADLFARWTVMETASSSLSVAGEVAGVVGTTTQGRSDNAPVLAVRQLGAVGKVKYRWGRLGLLLDAGFASGDQNPYDGSVDNFRFDSNYKVGLVLFDQVLGYQSARSAWRAADPLLSGAPPEGIELLPTAGAVTGAWYLFPRARYTVTSWLNVYGGPLFAFSTARLTDPFTTRMNGGAPLNSLGGRAGNVLGTELDVGVSVSGSPVRYVTVTATLEGGYLLPGDAFRTQAGPAMPDVWLGRLRLVLSGP
ncbi:MAG: hypothetical protein HY906_08320 [Deltaproteobacteria bacterium]|nr:hypothetical protein [Deltaproteobacteria bacterium]